MQFKLTGLLRLTVYFAVGAWLYSLGVRYGLLFLLGTIFGYEIGSRSEYPTILLTACGTVFGIALSMAIYFALIEYSSAKLFMFFGITVWRFLLAIIWLTAIGMFVWLVTRRKNGQANLC